MELTFPKKILEELATAFSQDRPKNSRGLQKPIHIIGSRSPVFVASFLGSPDFFQTLRRPQVILVKDDATAQDLETDIYFFNPKATVLRLSGLDISPYSGLYPNPRLIAERIFWLYRAQYSTGGEIFIAPVSAFFQKTLPKVFLDQNTFTFHLNDEFSPELIKRLSLMGYQNSPRVEDVGQFNVKGGIIDIFSPAHENPIRIELFGDFIESLRFFNAETQRTLDLTKELVVLPVREVLYHESAQELVLKKLNEKYREDSFPREQKDFLYENLVQKKFFHGIDFFLSYFYQELGLPADFFESSVDFYYLDSLEIMRQFDLYLEELKKDSARQPKPSLLPQPNDFCGSLEALTLSKNSRMIQISSVEILNPEAEEQSAVLKIHYPTQDFLLPHRASGSPDSAVFLQELSLKIKSALEQKQTIIVSTRTSSQMARLHVLLEKYELPLYIHEESFCDFGLLKENFKGLVNLILRPLSESIILKNDDVLFLREEDFFGKKEHVRRIPKKTTAYSKSVILSDLRVGDLVTHSEFGVGVYEGLKTMALNDVQNEFVQLRYQDDAKLYLPVYRINLIRKYSGVAPIDKLGTQAWNKTKIKVKNHLRDVAADLLNLYAKRSQSVRAPFSAPDLDFKTFEGQFLFDETEDQLKTIDSILEDMQKESPMDRLVCGDVGFGKTEVAMRAAFKAVQCQKQVAVLVPTTILCFQHYETFKKRFESWPIRVEMLSRFISATKARTIIKDIKDGKVDIVIGTHRLLSKDMQFKNLGLLVVDEEHKFGVTHKEKIKKLKSSVDTIAMSATPIPRTLNMSLVGIRDLSLINTPPQDRLPVRTFICKFDDSIIKNAIESEVQRGGQVFFLHNRVQSIAEFAGRIQDLVPNVRVRFAHGQMDESALEETMISFFKQEFDVLVSTTIIESGMDIPRANTIIIDRAGTLGLSQLYQLRGRVGRSKERAYCYLLIPQTGVMDPAAQERLKVLQENSELGSGIRIAHHDLELRGAGNILGEEQAGHANAVGFELYLELLEQALKEARGEDTQKDELEPEINLRIAALIPDEYIPDIRVRIGYYNALSKIESPEDMDRFEEDLNDQFGKVPEQVMNLMGIMLLKKYCKDLAIRDLTAGTKSITLSFADFTPLKPETLIELVTGHKKKYSITPDSRLVIQMKEISWPQIYAELNSLKELVTL